MCTEEDVARAQQAALAAHDFDEEMTRLNERCHAFQDMLVEEAERVGCATPPLVAAKTNAIEQRFAVAAALLQRIRDDYTSGRIASYEEQQQQLPPEPPTRRVGLRNTHRQVLNRWFLEHIDHPYPTEQEKRQLAEQVGLTLQQICTFFGNKRMRFKQSVKKKGRL